MKKYLFFYLKTGSGHLAPAKAVAEKIRSKHKSYTEILLVDGLSESNPFVKKVIEDGYRNAVNKAVWTFEFLYAIHKITAVSKLTSSLVSYFIKPGIEKKIVQLNPKKIVLFHFFLIKPVCEIIEKHHLDIPVITVVTDPFTAPPIWFLQKGQNYIVFSELLRDKCLERGINNDKLKVFPLVLDNKFSRKIRESEKLRIRKDLDFEPYSKVILIMGGGDGMPRGKKILKNIITRNMNAEIAIVCGKNKKLFSQAMKLKYKCDCKRLKVYGYIDLIYSLINISDVVVTKCGASTFMEVLLIGKVPVINNYIWEQEKGNMEYVCKGDMGILEKKPGLLPDVIHRLLTDNELYNSFSINIRNAFIRNGVGQVSDYILDFQ